MEAESATKPPRQQKKFAAWGYVPGGIAEEVKARRRYTPS
jgi:hypothetical protein